MSKICLMWCLEIFYNQHMLYYVIQVATNKESVFCENVKKLSSFLSDNYKFIHLTRELTIRRQGKTFKEIKPVFSSYVFMESQDGLLEGTLTELKEIPGFAKILNSNTDISPLTDHDLSVLQHFLRIGEKIGTSVVRFDENDRIVVVEGPLQGLEGNIIKVDRRKKRAKVQIDVKGYVHAFDLSFEDIGSK